MFMCREVGHNVKRGQRTEHLPENPVAEVHRVGDEVFRNIIPRRATQVPYQFGQPVLIYIHHHQPFHPELQQCLDIVRPDGPCAADNHHPSAVNSLLQF